MATLSHSQAVKSLNKSSGRKRFVFKNFSQRIEEIDIGEKVFRSLDPLKAEPSEGSSFLRDCLIEWRELNTAEDFISFYEEMMPWVHTLPQVLFHKDTIMSKLISRLQIKARLSLAPILRLIAALSRDLLKDFLPFLPRITNAIVDLLENGAEREPEVTEQIFTSWSYIMMYLKRYLMQDIHEFLKTTVHLSYYPKDYIEEFMAESVSFLLRNAPDKQLAKGINEIIHEVVTMPSDARKSGASAFLWHVMRGTSSNFHSKAERVLRLLMSNDLVGSDAAQGSETVVEVLAATYQRICKELELNPKELKLLWDCLFDEISSAMSSGSLLHLSHVLSLLISTINCSKGGQISDYQSMLGLVRSLVEKFVAPGHQQVEHYNKVVDKVLQLILCLLDEFLNSSDMSAINSISSQWAPVFELRNESLLTFIGILIQKDPYVVDAFRSYILSALSYFVETSQSSEVVAFLMMMFFKNLQGTCNCLDAVGKEKVSRICSFLQEFIMVSINDIAKGDESAMHFNESKLAIVWAILNCYPHFLALQADPSLIMDLVRVLDQLPITKADKVAGVPSQTWQSLLGAALATYHNLHLGQKSALAEKTKTFLDLAQKYKSSAQVLSAVAEFLDFVQGSPLLEDSGSKAFHPELEAKKAIQAISVFADNLCLPDQIIRISTLRILSHYEPVGRMSSVSDQPAEKKLQTDANLSCTGDANDSNVIQLLLSIEATPLSVSTSRKVIVLVSRVQMGLTAARFSEVYVPLLFNGIIGIFHKRFAHLWDPALDCLSVLVDRYMRHIWDRFISYLELCQLEFLTSGGDLRNENADCPRKSSDLVDYFNQFVSPESDSTPCLTVLSLLLRSLQKTQAVVEPRSRPLIPLFFKFLGYTDDLTRSCNVGLFHSHSCKGKEWRAVLKEWLNLLNLMRNPKSLYQSQILKEVLMNRLLDEKDADIQMKALDCLLNWRDDFLLPYDQHLKILITSKNLQEELATWTLSKETHHIQGLHRVHLIPIIVRLLTSKVRNLKRLASQKHASVQRRRAILGFLAQLEINELSLFFFLLVRPLELPSGGIEEFSKWFWISRKTSREEFDMLKVVEYFTVHKITEISWKKRYGFLHLFEDILKSFDEMHVRPFLNLLMGLLVRILESCTISLALANSYETSSGGNFTIQKTISENTITYVSPKRLKDQRSFCLKIICLVLNKYEHHNFGCAFWDIFFTSVKDLIDLFKEEGSSSKRPSSLFKCFIAMSRSYTLASLLQRERDLVPSIFSMLTVKTASNAITDSVLSFIENLLNLDNDLGNQNDLVIRNVLLPNLGTLISSLHSFFQCHTENQRKSVKWLGKTGLRIFKLLSSYITEPFAALQFVDILLPFLGRRTQSSDKCLECLRVIHQIVPRLGSETTAKILNAIAPLLIYVGMGIRLAICDLLDSLALNDPSVAFLAKLIREMNAVSLSEIGELDYDARVNAYEAVDHQIFSTTREDHALVILSHSVYDMSSDELILRQCAQRLILSFVDFSALVLDSLGRNSNKASEAVVAYETAPCWTKVCIQRMVKKFFLKHIGDAMNKGMSIQREWISLLREMVLKLPQIPVLNSVKDLCSKDAEVDFFNNILHLQIHRRARALTRFRKTIETAEFSETITKKVFVPLFFTMLFDVQDGKGEHLRNPCLESLAAISGHMRWDSYHAFLLRCFRELSLRSDKQKILLRLICCILDQFHFRETCASMVTHDTECEVPSPGMVGVTSLTTSPGLIDSGHASEIQVLFQKTILPKRQNLPSADTERINVVVNLVALKLLKLLPVDAMDSQLSSIIHRVCNFLKNRMESIRDEARIALVVCLKELGLEYLQLIVKVLRTTLKRGYELHVLGYTLNFILLNILGSATGKLDYCLDELLLVLENDILGNVAQEKEVEKIASKMKETGKSKSFETLKLIAQNVTFKTHALKLLSPVKAHLESHLTPKLKAKLETMLSHIAKGIEKNSSVDETDLFVFVYGLIEDGIAEETLKGESSLTPRSSKQSSNEVSNSRKSSPWITSYQSQSSHLITVFALGVLHSRLSNIRFAKKDEQLLSILDPFVKLLSNCLTSKYEDILSVALRCLVVLLRLPLPSHEIQAGVIKSLLLDIAQKSGSSNSPLVDACLRLLTALLRSTRITLSNDQLHMLIQFPLFVDLKRYPSSISLSVLKAIVGRKLIVPEIYDIVTRVAELMVTNQDEHIRKKCSKILLQFLLDYPLSNKRLQQHLDFFLANLSYEHSTGREAVLEMLHAIIIKFPKHTVDEQAKTLFMHLVLCLANDQDNKVRSMVGVAIKLLIGRTSQNALESILEYSLSWYKDERKNLWSAAAQVLGLLVEVLKKGFRRHINDVLPTAKSILKSSLFVTNEQSNCSAESTVHLWREAYYSLILLEKMLHQFPELHFEQDLEDIWDSICESLLYPHMWIRNISNRLVASYFSAVSEAGKANPEKFKLQTFLLMKSSRLFAVAVSFCCQLKVQLTDDAASNLIVQNLVFAICGVHSLTGQRECADAKVFWSTLEVCEQGHIVKAFQLLGSRRGKIMLAHLSDASSQNDQNPVEDLQSFFVSPLLKRMGKLALQMEVVQTKIVLNFFKTMSSQFGHEGCIRYAFDLLYPLYKVCEGFVGKVFTEEIKQLAEEVRESIKGVIGLENFVKTYNEIRKSVKSKRDKRKHQEKLMAVVNPMRNAKRKLRISAKHQANKKRKIMAMKMGKWNA